MTCSTCPPPMKEDLVATDSVFGWPWAFVKRRGRRYNAFSLKSINQLLHSQGWHEQERHFEDEELTREKRVA